MLKQYLMALVCSASALYLPAQVQYPETYKSDMVRDYHGTKVADPFDWLEDDRSEATAKWVRLQNEVTNGYLTTIPFREPVRKRITQLMNYPRHGTPFREGSYLYFTRNDGLQNQSVWYRQKMAEGAAPEIFIDPNKLSKEGLVSLGNLSFSKNAKYAAYALQSAGSDWQEGYIMDVATKKTVADKLEWLKFTGFSWKGDEGFYYTRYPEQDEKAKLSAKNQGAQIYYHKLGTKQSDDQLIYEDNNHPNRFLGISLTEDERFLVLRTSEGTSGGELWVQDLKNPESTLSLLIAGFQTEPSVVDNIDNKLLIRTNEGAPNYKLVLVDPKAPGKENWKTIVEEQSSLLESVSTGGGQLFLTYLKDASSKVYQYTYEGKQVREIKLPGIGTASGFEAKKEHKEFYYSFTSYNYPPTIFKYNIANGSSVLFKKTDAKINPDDFEVKQIFYVSKDGTRVPMFLTYKKGMKQNGQNPVMLYAYGGFNLPERPSFSAARMLFIEQGGIYATACIRGGSEYGENWHKAGMLQNKQNVFDDFIAAADWLIQDQYTSADKLAIMGASNGGLLVGACMTQRPDLFKVAIPMVGVMDMLRFHTFTIGYAWATEYGSSEQKDQFEYLYKYSPLHNLKKETTYPATMVTTADHDDRVVPAHSFKFAATLQECQLGKNPALIRIETNAGHGGGMPVSKQINLWTDVWSFVMYQFGMTYK